MDPAPMNALLIFVNKFRRRQGWVSIDHNLAGMAPKTQLIHFQMIGQGTEVLRAINTVGSMTITALRHVIGILSIELTMNALLVFQENFLMAGRTFHLP